MEKVYDICCGIDVHKKLTVACLRHGRTREIRQTGATTRELLELADWLKSEGCQMVAMESTGSSYFYARYTRICAHRGKKRACLAVAHSMLVAIYRILKDNVPFHDLGADYYNQFNKDSKIRAYLKKLHALGWTEPTATAVAPV